MRLELCWCVVDWDRTFVGDVDLQSVAAVAAAGSVIFLACVEFCKNIHDDCMAKNGIGYDKI